MLTPLSLSRYGVILRLTASRAVQLLVLMLASLPALALKLSEKTITLNTGEALTFDVGTVSVPENRATTDSRTIEVAFYRFKGDEGASAMPMVVLPGGPGGSYTRWLESERWQSMAMNRVNLFRRHGDVIFVDLRGVALSTPNAACDGAPNKWMTLFTEEDFNRLSRESAAACREKLIEEGFDLAGYTVMEAAADVVAVIDALGYDRFRLHGNSFGSHWSLTTLRYYPDRIERAIISGTEGYDHTWDHPAGLRRAAEIISEAATPAWQAAGRDGDPLSTLDALMARAIENPDLAHGMTPHEVALLGTSGAGYGITSREPLSGWPAAVAALDDGEGKLMRWGLRLAGAWFLGGASEDAAVVGTLDCASGLSAERRADMEAIDDPIFSRLAFSYYDTICPAWAVPELSDAFREGEQIDVPVLFVHGDLDAATPLRNAQETVQDFPNGHLVIMENGAHSAFRIGIRVSEELRDVVNDWMQGTAPTVNRITLPPLEFDPIPSP
ncbi:MAG: alpha/beta fold hydrolase [Pseudomonadota bacterium]